MFNWHWPRHDLWRNNHYALNIFGSWRWNKFEYFTPAVRRWLNYNLGSSLGVFGHLLWHQWSFSSEFWIMQASSTSREPCVNVLYKFTFASTHLRLCLCLCMWRVACDLSDRDLRHATATAIAIAIAPISMSIYQTTQPKTDTAQIEPQTPTFRMPWAW